MDQQVRKMIDEIYDANLRSEYLIPLGDKEAYKLEVQFILQYREKLKKACKNFWDATIKDKVYNCELGIKNLVALAHELVENMRSAEPSNIMRKLRFIDNIDAEINKIRESLVYLDKYDPYSYRQSSTFTKDLINFLKLVCSEALLQDGFLDKRISEMTEIVAEKLRNGLKSKFFSYLRDDSPNSADIYFLLGSSIQKYEDYKGTYNTYYKENCEECTIDDCMVYHCDKFSKRNSIDQSASTYASIKNLCIKKIVEEKNLDEREVRKVVCNIYNKDERQTTYDLLISNFVKPQEGHKKLIINWAPEHSVAIIPEKIKHYLLKNLSRGKEIDYNNVDDVAAYIMISFYDFSKTTGKEELSKFEQWYRSASFRKESNYEPLYINFDMLYEEFIKSKKVKNLELGEE